MQYNTEPQPNKKRVVIVTAVMAIIVIALLITVIVTAVNKTNQKKVASDTNSGEISLDTSSDTKSQSSTNKSDATSSKDASSSNAAPVANDKSSTSSASTSTSNSSSTSTSSSSNSSIPATSTTSEVPKTGAAEFLPVALLAGLATTCATSYAVAKCHIVGRDREITLNVLLGENRLTGGNAADDGDGDILRAGHLETVIQDLDRTCLRGVTADVAVLLQRVEVRMDGRRGAQMHGLAYLADRRRITLPQDLALQIIQNLTLFVGNVSVAHVRPPVPVENICSIRL